MRAEMYALHDAHESSHWWFVARRRIVLRMLRRELDEPPPAGLRLLDVGCGAGGMLGHLARFGSAIGVDPSPDAVAYSAARGADVRLGTLPDGLPFGADDRFDVITLLDVLEHVDDDDASLRTLRRLLAPAGLLVMTVPAFPFLWSGHDVVNEHRRRYTRPQLRQRLVTAGFDVRTLSYFNTALFPPIAAVRLLRRLSRGADEGGDLGVVPAPLNAVLGSVFAAERHVLPHVSLPFGVSLIATARVREDRGETR
jgi:SAM-dependent methyltransferase